jgi:hypothetical protein
MNFAKTVPVTDRYDHIHWSNPPVNIKLIQKMNIKDQKLESRLLYLSLDLNEKVLLWLAYRGIKPVSEITVERRNLAQLRKGIRLPGLGFSHPKIKKIRKWINDSGLYIQIEKEYSSSWHVGMDKEKVIKSEKIIRQFDYDSEIQSGIIFGFPEKSAKSYAFNRTVKSPKDEIKMVPPMDFTNTFLKDKYYTSYIMYAIDARFVEKDSQVAKLWADTIRKDIPILSRWYEAKMEKRRKKTLSSK